MVSILKKQRQTVDDFKIKIEGEREPGKIPSLWKSINVTFELYGNIDIDKAKKPQIDQWKNIALLLKHCAEAAQKLPGR